MDLVHTLQTLNRNILAFYAQQGQLEKKMDAILAALVTLNGTIASLVAAVGSAQFVDPAKQAQVVTEIGTANTTLAGLVSKLAPPPTA